MPAGGVARPGFGAVAAGRQCCAQTIAVLNIAVKLVISAGA